MPPQSLPRHFARAALLLLALLALADAAWLYTASDWLYRPRLGALLNPQPVLWAALAFYLLYWAGLCLFVLRPALIAGSVRLAGALGAAFGLVAYGTYDLTNQATIAGWPPLVTLIDMTWGSLLSATSCALACALALRFTANRANPQP